jgi:AbrB family looped-hinge helix DNA binding protein
MTELLCKEMVMAELVSVKVSSRYQISVPSVARERLNIQSGDRLLVDVQDGLLILLPQPQNYTARLAGLYREVWEGLDTTAYLQEERTAWKTSSDE